MEGSVTSPNTPPAAYPTSAACPRVYSLRDPLDSGAMRWSNRVHGCKSRAQQASLSCQPCLGAGLSRDWWNNARIQHISRPTSAPTPILEQPWHCPPTPDKSGSLHASPAIHRCHHASTLVPHPSRHQHADMPRPNSFVPHMYVNSRGQLDRCRFHYCYSCYDPETPH